MSEYVADKVSRSVAATQSTHNGKQLD